MILAFSTNAYTRFSLPDAVADIAAAGFGGVEILADTPHAYPGTLSAAQVSELRRQLSALNLQVSNVNANCSFGYWKDAPPEPYFEPSLISPDPKRRADRAALIRLAIEFAAEIGARNLSITSGRCLGGMPPDKAGAQFVESIKPLLDYADSKQIDIGIECEPGLFLEYADELAETIRAIGHPRLGANLDIGHSQVLGENLGGAIHTLAGRIWNLHVEDIPGRKHYHLVPGEGTLPWAEVRDALVEVKYDRCVTVELYTCTENPQAAARASFAFLDRLFHPHTHTS